MSDLDAVAARERREKLLSATRFRRVLIVVLAVLTYAGVAAGRVPDFPRLWLLFVVGLLCNEWARINFRDGRRVTLSLWAALGVDILGLSFFVYLTGSAASYLVGFYAVQVVGTAILAQARYALATAAASVAAYGGLIVAERFGGLSHWPRATPGGEAGFAGLALDAAGFAAALGAAAYCAGTLAERLKIRERDLAAANRELARLARTDALTGLFNRRTLEARLREELERAARLSQPFAILMCDIDHFKRINDTDGHPAGDAVLAGVARTLLSSVRAIDAVGRFGGEEFLLVLPQVAGAEAAAAAERVRRAVESSPALWGGRSLPVTVSVGVSHFPADGPDAESLVAVADRRLYRAKGEGRNRVVAM